MAITEASPPPDRPRKVAWFDSEPPRKGRRAFEDRGFVVESVDRAKIGTSIDLAGLSAIVFTQTESNLDAIVDQVAAHAELLLDCDLRVIVRLAPNSDAKKVQESLVNRLPGVWLAELSAPSFPPLPHIRMFGARDQWKDLANYVAENPCGPAPRPADALTVTMEDSTGSLVPLKNGSDELLLRRAFADCATLHLAPMGERGRSGVTYRAFAEIANPTRGKWPVPYFVKLASKGETVKEHANYVEHVVPYVPFHLGPHLAAKRCCLGARKGVLVGDFVAESEILATCAPDGRAAAALACLFDRTLHGWHQDTREVKEPLCQRLHLPMVFDDALRSRAKSLGATLQPNDLLALFKRCTSIPVLYGAAHGDLHARNVLVRATDAIMIDFMAHDVHPLLRDVAILEASLLVDGFASVRVHTKPEDLLVSLSPLYERFPTKPGIPNTTPRDSSSWFYRAVRQLRPHAHQMERGHDQYAGALAWALLNAAKRNPNASDPRPSLRAVAYVLAERLLVHAFSS